MRRWCCLLSGTLVLALSGCEEPSQVVPSSPPGAIEDRIPESEKGDHGAQALGEQVRAKDLVKPETTPAGPTAPGETKTIAEDLKYETLQAGTGEEVKLGQTALVKYVGKLDDGTVFDSNQDAPGALCSQQRQPDCRAFSKALWGCAWASDASSSFPPGWPTVQRASLPRFRRMQHSPSRSRSWASNKEWVENPESGWPMLGSVGPPWGLSPQRSRMPGRWMT